MKIQIKYFEDILPLVKKGDWIDLRSAVDVRLEKGEFALIPLGVAMKLPPDHEAHVVPRSSTYKNFGIIQANSFGVIDQDYNGDGDQWYFPAIAMRDTAIRKNDRICQFRVQRVQPVIEFERVEFLEDDDRGGFGSTGTA